MATNPSFQAYAFKVDISNEASVVAMVEFTIQKFARIDYCVNSAGVSDCVSDILYTFPLPHAQSLPSVSVLTTHGRDSLTRMKDRGRKPKRDLGCILGRIRVFLERQRQGYPSLLTRSKRVNESPGKDTRPGSRIAGATRRRPRRDNQPRFMQFLCCNPTDGAVHCFQACRHGCDQNCWYVTTHDRGRTLLRDDWGVST